MKPTIYTLLILFLATSFASCEKDIEFKGEIADPMIVLNSMLTPDSVAALHLSQSRFVLGESGPITPITGADVSLFVNGNLKEQLPHVAEGIYKGSYYPLPADVIKITAVAEGYGPVEAHAVIPKRANVTMNDSTVIHSESEVDAPGIPGLTYKLTYRDMQLQLQLNDPAGEENYYYVKATRNTYQGGELLNSSPVEVNLNELLKNNIDDSGFIFDGLFDEGGGWERAGNIFSDLLINGRRILIDFSFRDIQKVESYLNGNKTEEEEPEIETVEYVVEIAEISRDLYQYVLSGQKAKNAEDFGPFTEPVQIHTNIKNGIGILGVYNPYRLTSRFQAYNNQFYYLPGYYSR